MCSFVYEGIGIVKSCCPRRLSKTLKKLTVSPYSIRMPLMLRSNATGNPNTVELGAVLNPLYRFLGPYLYCHRRLAG